MARPYKLSFLIILVHFLAYAGIFFSTLRTAHRPFITQMIMSDSKFFDGAKDEANSSPSGTPAGGNVPFLSMNNQLQMSVEPEKNINLNFECGLLKRAQKRQRRNLEEEKEKSNGARSPAAGKNCGT
uniref:Uncharacterized protein n=1 Tax=Salix viminalis TaxID=40686 RepID=A0A6N2M7Z0_SALVM